MYVCLTVCRMYVRVISNYLYQSQSHLTSHTHQKPETPVMLIEIHAGGTMLLQSALSRQSADVHIYIQYDAEPAGWWMLDGPMGGEPGSNHVVGAGSVRRGS